MSYLVMECHPGYAILLDENGRFLRAANFCYEVGQTVYDPVLMKETQEKQNHAIQWIRGGIAAVAACLLLFLGFGYYQNYLQPYSSIYLTINPEVQMDLNRQGTVVALAGTNEDGEELIEGYNGKGKDKVTVADELIDRAINMGFLSEGGQVSFSIDTPEEVLFQEYGAELRTSVTEYLDGRIAVTIEIMNYADRQSPEPSASSTPAAKPTGSPEPVKSVTALPADSSDYGDTDYGSGNSGKRDDASRPAKSSASADTDYGAGSDDTTDYNDTDDGPENDGDTGYAPPPAKPSVPADTGGGTSDYTDGDTDYDPGHQAEDDDDDNRDDDEGGSGYGDDDDDDGDQDDGNNDNNEDDDD